MTSSAHTFRGQLKRDFDQVLNDFDLETANRTATLVAAINLEAGPEADFSAGLIEYHEMRERIDQPYALIRAIDALRSELLTRAGIVAAQVASTHEDCGLWLTPNEIAYMHSDAKLTEAGLLITFGDGSRMRPVFDQYVITGYRLFS